MVKTKIALSLFVSILLLLSCNKESKQFYISTLGNDDYPGTKSLPFATLQRARDAVRQLEKNDTINIVIRQGLYHLPEPLILGPGDSGTEELPVIWRAAENERVILSGGKMIDSKWQTDDGKIWFTDIPEAAERKWIFRQLFVDGKRISRARFPNKTASNPFLYAVGGTDSSVVINQNLIRESWGKALDAQINMVPNWKFFNQWNTVKSVDIQKAEIFLANSELHAKITKGNWFWIEGIKEELDEPEEWFLDGDIGRLYYMPVPGQDPNSQVIIAPRLNRLIYAKGDVEAKAHVNYVHFKDLEFRHTTFTLDHIEPRVHTDATIMLENACDFRIENCHFENIGGYALWLHLDSKRNLFHANTVLESGAGGVLFTGARFSYMDDSKLYTPGDVASSVFPILNLVTHNTVKHCGKIRYYGGGVHLDSRPASMSMAPGNYIAHNHFQYLSRNGIFAFRNQGGNVVEYNHIHDAMQTTIDGACIHFATMNHLNAPNFIMNNYLYDIWGYEQKPDGQPVRHLANGIFLDWATSNTTVKNNYIYNAGGEPIKNIMGNWNLTISDNKTSKTRIIPPFINEVGPGGTATHGIDIEKNHLTGSVIHYTDKSLVEYKGNWKPRKMEGFWNLFSFNLLEADIAELAEISYTLPIVEDGMYQVSVLYLPDDQNASNAKIRVKHAEGTSEKIWNMKEGDKFGFALVIGHYHFKKNGVSEVTISNENTDGIVVANSVAFVKADAE
jgi:hypothetical protein